MDRRGIIAVVEEVSSLSNEQVAKIGLPHLDAKLMATNYTLMNELIDMPMLTNG